MMTSIDPRQRPKRRQTNWPPQTMPHTSDPQPLTPHTHHHYSTQPTTITVRAREKSWECKRDLNTSFRWGKKKKKKEYFKNIISFPLFGSLSRREWKDHSLVWEFKWRVVWEFKWREWNGTLIPPYHSKPQIFILQKIGRNRREWI